MKAPLLRRLFFETLESRRLLASLDGSDANLSSDVAPRIINGTPTGLFPSVGLVGDTTGNYCTGTLIAPQYVLTAAHCAVDGSSIVGNTQGRVTFGSTVYSTSRIFVHPSYSEANFGTDTANDIAIYKLNQTVSGITPSSIYRTVPTVGSSLTLVGYGGGGTGNTGSDGTYGTKRVGTTTLDRVSSTLIHWNFDNNSESNTAPGDSGGPAFLDIGGEYVIAGVTSGGTLTNAGLGDQSYDTRVDVYQAWIDSIVNASPTTASIQYATADSLYLEGFDSLTNTGSGLDLPSGFSFLESGTNANNQYTASNGNATAGDTYSFGTTGSGERALGSLRSNALGTTLGATIQNRTGQNLISMTVNYIGEQWRLGTTGRQDKFDFQYSVNATSLTDGNWTDVDSLDFIAPVTSGTIGPVDGNQSANRVSRSATISSLNIADGAVIWLRWNDLNASGADDGLGIDNFSFQASTGGPANTPPTITPPADVSSPYQTATSPLAFTINDQETSPGSLVVTASSSNTLLLPNNQIVLGGTGANRTVTLTPATGQSGTTTVTLSVSDGSLTSSGTFQWTVEAGTDQGLLRLVSYNIAAASGDGTPRAGFASVLQAIGSEIVSSFSRQIDLLALQEVLSQATTSTIVSAALNSVYGTTAYATGALDGATTGSGTQGVVYNSQTLQLLGEAAIGTASSSGAPRQTMRYHFRPVGSAGAHDFYLYNSHLKAADDTDSAARRLIEAQTIRDDADALGAGVSVIYVGDFNLYRSSEPAYQEFLAAGNAQAFDPVNRPGNWSGNSNFVDIFTQAPSANPPLGLDGGGLDDRLDFQLISGELQDGSGLEYRPGSYHTFGNNGSVPVNGSINAAGSTALPGMPNRVTILNLLTTVSDHLPVVADYTFPTAAASVVNRQIFYHRSPSEIFGNGSGNPTTAIDPTKVALLPGQQAAFANYTNYALGLNGLLVDIQGASANISAADFQFSVGTAISSNSFTPLTVQPTVTVFPTGGSGNSTRIKLEFEDRAISNTWLRVTVLANDRTRLATNDTFYFGNAMGDFNVGNIGDPIIVRTNASDTSAVRANQSTGFNSVGISNIYDLNKDGRVNSSDTSITRQSTQAAILALFTAPTGLQLARRSTAVNAESPRLAGEGQWPSATGTMLVATEDHSRWPTVTSRHPTPRQSLPTLSRPTTANLMPLASASNSRATTEVRTLGRASARLQPGLIEDFNLLPERAMIPTIDAALSRLAWDR